MKVACPNTGDPVLPQSQPRQPTGAPQNTYGSLVMTLCHGDNRRMRDDAPDELTGLALRVGAEARAAGLSRDVPNRDPRLDDLAGSLPSFRDFRSAMASLDFFVPFYGDAAQDRLALAWVYASASDGEVDSTWAEFWDRLCDPTWTYAAVAHLLNYESDCDLAAFPDGLEVRVRSLRALSDILGWSQQDLQATLGSDFAGFGVGRFVVVYRESVPKSPAMLVTGNTGGETIAIRRLLQALRLTAGGDVNVGRIYHCRVRPVVPDLGIMMSWSSLDRAPGPAYVLGQGNIADVRETYDLCRRFDGRIDTYPQITAAVGRLSSAYDRSLGGLQDRIIDDFVGLEALVGSDQELAYKLAIRVSGLLAETDEDRIVLFKRVKSFYDTRSKIVHGGALRPTHQANVQAEPELRDILRRLLLGFLRLTDSANTRPTRKFVEEQLDEVLLDTKRRSALRGAMGLLPARLAQQNTGQQGAALWSEHDPAGFVAGPPAPEA